MKKSIYRNFYYVKESILEFIQCNKKYILFSVFAIIVGVALGLCVGLNNCNNFTVININDKTIVAFFSKGSFFNFFICNVLKFLFLEFLILILNNFSFVRFICYLVFGYLSFILVVDCIIIICLFGLHGTLFCFLGYLLINLAIIAMLVVVSLLCKISCDCNGNSSKFCCYPYKNIFCVSLIIGVLILLLGIIAQIFSNFIVIIV